MTRPGLLSILLTLMACQGEGAVTVVADGDSRTTPPSTTTGTGAGTATGTGTGGGCGDVSTWAMQVEGRVVDPTGSGVPFADVWLEDRGWNPTVTVMGSGQADGGGFFAIDVPELVDVENCWGVILDYALVAEQGPMTGERGINSSLFNAIQDGTFTATVADLEIGP